MKRLIESIIEKNKARRAAEESQRRLVLAPLDDEEEEETVTLLQFDDEGDSEDVETVTLLGFESTDTGPEEAFVMGLETPSPVYRCWSCGARALPPEEPEVKVLPIESDEERDDDKEKKKKKRSA
ncbi:MAG: hypothetical protein CMJ64_10355 [Planctomycetaceae bacterium]|nr:hypothetical protein [Planctomycetaceae bacterium]